MALLAAMIAFGRYASDAGLDPFQVVFFRNLFCVLIMLPLLAIRGPALYQTSQLHLYFPRVLVGFIAMSGMYHAIALIPLGEVTAIGFLSPLFGTLFAIALLGEKVRARRWIALAVGFFGAMIVLRPTTSTIGIGQIAAIISAMGIGLIGPLVKKLTHNDDADRIVFLSNVFLTPLSLIPALFVWQWPSWDLWPFLAAMGLCAMLGHAALVRAYSVSDASFVMTVKFVRLPFTIAIGFLIFNEAIDAIMCLGAFVIFAASSYITHREANLKTEKPPPKLLG